MTLTVEQISDTINFDVRKLYELIGEFRKEFGRTVNVSNVIEAVTMLMKMVGRMKTLHGEDKKFIVTKLLIFFVEETNSAGDIDDVMDTIVITLIPVVIDKLIYVESGKLKFNKKPWLSCIN